MTLRMDELATQFDDVMFDRVKSCPGKQVAEGFTIGQGKQLYWHIEPARCGGYKCYPQYGNGKIGHPRYVAYHDVVTIHFKKNTQP